MERYKIILKIDKIKKNLEEGKCQEALNLAEKIDLRKVKNLSDLGIIAECYFQNGIYAKAKEIFSRIYEQNPSRRVTAQMVHLSIKLNEIIAAEYYLKEFIKLAPDDFYRYIFQYSIDKQKKESLSTLIEDLVHLKETEYIESWAYELAKLYHKAGKKEECIQECENLILWFGNGEYVDRARALKSYYLGELDAELIQSNETESVVEEESKAAEEGKIEEDEKQQVSVEIPKIEETLEDKVEENQEPLSEQELASELQTMKDTENDISLDKEQVIEEQEVQEEPTKKIQTVEKVIFPVESNEDLISSEEYQDLLSCVLQKKVNLGLMLGNYARVPQIKEQIIRSLDQMMAQSVKQITLVITGESDFEMTGLAKRLSKISAYLGISDSRRLALVHGEKLNHINLLDKLSQLKECAIVIEHAGQMTKTSVNMIKELNEVLNTRIIIILEDTRKDMDKLLSENPSLTSLFTNRIHLPEITEETVMGYLYDYVTERDYEVECTAFNEIRKKVQTLLLDRRDEIFEHMIPKINQIMENAKTRSTRQLMEMSQSGKYVTGELMTIRKEDLID